jgi:CDP-paratose 2-epimerase
VYHFAAQTAVTTSMVDPEHDFDVNARGTLRLLEAVKACDSPPMLLFTSTNKVYGGLSDIALRCVDRRYQPIDDQVRAEGIAETRPLDFHTPYGCSKGTADQYVLEYARSFGLPATLFRMSCIYGPHQCGTEDQGWVAHFLLRALDRRPITLFGDGMQVRDILFVDDLVDAFLRAERHIDRLSGRAFNIGGGPGNVISLLALLDRIEALEGRRPEVEFEDWRTGDQRYYVSDTRAFQEATGWAPRVGAAQGIERLHRWLRELRRDEAAASAVDVRVPAPRARATFARAGGAR